MDKKNETSQKRAGEEIGLRSVVCRIPKDCLVPGNPFAVHLNLPSNTWRLLSSAQQPLRVGRSRRATTVCKVFEVGPFLSPLLPLGTAALLRRGAEPSAVSPSGLRGHRGRAYDRSGAGEGAQKLEPNQRGVQLPSPNLQVTPRGGGRSSGGSGGDQRPQQLGAPSGEEASRAPLHRQPSAGRRQRSGLGGSRGRAGTWLPPPPADAGRARPVAPESAGPRRAPPPPLRAALNAGGVRGCGGSGCGGSSRSRESGPPGLCFAGSAAAVAATAPVVQDAAGGRTVRPARQPAAAVAASPALVLDRRARPFQVPTRPPRSGSPACRAPGDPSRSATPLGCADFGRLRGLVDGQRRPGGGVGRGSPGGSAG